MVIVRLAERKDEEIEETDQVIESMSIPSIRVQFHFLLIIMVSKNSFTVGGAIV